MNVKLQTEHYLEFLSLKGGCTGSFESTLDKMPHCWKSHFGCCMYSWSVQHFISLDLNDLTSLYFTLKAVNCHASKGSVGVDESVCMYMHILNVCLFV